jgi:hypothetical protein
LGLYGHRETPGEAHRDRLATCGRFSTGLLALRRFRARGDSREWHQGQGKYADYRFYSDVSVDNSNAVLYGYAIYYDLAADVDRLMTHLLDNHYRIVDLDGEVTQYGHVGIDPDRRATAPLCSMPKPTAARR